MSTRLRSNDTPGTFEWAEMELLRDGLKASVGEKLMWLEDAGEFAAMCRKMLFEKGKPAIGLDGEVVWSEEEYWGYPEGEG
ncbi:MAG: hypothetical protein AAGC74_09730 [Verrucomicrobiota bacterium]